MYYTMMDIDLLLKRTQPHLKKKLQSDTGLMVYVLLKFTQPNLGYFLTQIKFKDQHNNMSFELCH